ncbi:uncharacterized protein PAC_19954 [Phialocephala subalpina]|uniref:NB-ARC domain-containing protein n=1 Tax=Phialocephala subalpina TaxID=576137 RepID=A0A1L7XYA2_9HELO|nr:uncharacterized protein PAC_19954 [Phialocephala subalpina]
MSGVEILGAVASAVQVADICIRITDSLVEFYSRVHDAPEKINQRTVQIAQLKEMAHLIERCPSLQISPVTSILKSISHEARRLEDILTQATTRGNEGKVKRKLKSVGFALKEKQVESICTRLESEKTTLLLCIAGIDSALLSSINLEVVKIQDTSNNVLNELPAIRDIAQGVVTVFGNRLASQVEDLQNRIPNIASDISRIKDELPVITLAVDPQPTQYVCIAADDFKRLDATRIEPTTTASKKNHQLFIQTLPEDQEEIVVKSLPIIRIVDYVDRKALLEQVNIAFSSPISTVKVAVLIGMGGSGKTQLAMKYCQLQSDRNVSVLWADASSERSLKQSYSVFAQIISKALCLTTTFPNPDASMLYVNEYLRSSLKRWLLVFDNYDTPSEFEDIRAFIPDAAHGTIIITSRSREAARLGEDIEVNGMHEPEALELLLRRTGSPTTPQNLEHGRLIVNRLGYLPLAIDQAGSYVRRQNVPLNRFINHYERRREHVLRHTPQLWEYKRRLGTEEQESRLSVFTTWELAFEQLELCKMVKETDMIKLSGFLHHTCISEELFEAHFEGSVDPGGPKAFTDNESAWDKYQFRDIVVNLRELFLIQDVSPDSNGPCKVSLHPLVSDWIKLRENVKTRQDYSTEAIKIVTSFLRSRFLVDASPQTNQETLAHLDQCLTNDEAFLKDDSRLGLGILRRSADIFGEFCHSQGRYQSAEDLYKRLWDGNERELGPTHVDTLRTMHNLADVYHSKGQHAEAEALYDRTLSGREIELGRNHLDTLSTVEKLANIYRSKGQHKDAEKLYYRVLNARNAQLGCDHIDSLWVVSSIATNKRAQGQFAEAEELYKRAISGYESQVEPGNAALVWTMNDLANNLRSQGRYTEAAALFHRVLEVREKRLGREHPDTLWVVDDLANNCSSQGRYAEAETLYIRALAGNAAKLGDNHPETLWTVHGLATVVYSQGRLAEAEVLFNRALTGRESLLGPNHHNTLRTVRGLADVYCSQNQYAAAEKLYRRALAGLETRLGHDHPDALSAVEGLAKSQWMQGNCDEAEELYVRALEGRKSRPGHRHPETLRTADLLAGYHRSRAHSSEAH